MSKFYNLLVDTFRNGGYKHVIHLASRLEKHLASRLENIPSELYLNVVTGYFISDSSTIHSEFVKRPSKKHRKNINFEGTFKVFGKGVLPLAYSKGMIGEEHKNEADRILELYEYWILNYYTFKDEIVTEQLVKGQLDDAEENAGNSQDERTGKQPNDDEESFDELNVGNFDREERRRQKLEPLPKKKKKKLILEEDHDDMERNCFLEERNCFLEEQEYPEKKFTGKKLKQKEKIKIKEENDNQEEWDIVIEILI